MRWGAHLRNLAVPREKLSGISAQRALHYVEIRDRNRVARPCCALDCGPRPCHLRDGGEHGTRHHPRLHRDHLLRRLADQGAALRAHNDPEYTRAKRALRANPQPCQLRLAGCTGLATTLDHQPRLMDHTHVRGTGCCRLVPACLHCNLSDGGSAARRRERNGYSWP